MKESITTNLNGLRSGFETLEMKERLLFKVLIEPLRLSVRDRSETEVFKELLMLRRDGDGR